MLDNGSAALSSKKSFQARHLQDNQFCSPLHNKQIVKFDGTVYKSDQYHIHLGYETHICRTANFACCHWTRPSGPPPHNYTLPWLTKPFQPLISYNYCFLQCFCFKSKCSNISTCPCPRVVIYLPAQHHSSLGPSAVAFYALACQRCT